MTNAIGGGGGVVTLPSTPSGAGEAGRRLREGGLVAFPTETVYGLGGNALDDRAVAKIFTAKGRPSFNPLISHFPSADAARAFAHFDERADILAQTFWPGPLTMVLPRRAEGGLSLLVSAGLDSVALRVPGHPVARMVLEAAGVPVAAPSANRSGSISPTTPRHVIDSLGAAAEAVIAGGKCAIGVESTVIDLTSDQPMILRPGSILAEDIAALIGAVIDPGALVADAGDAPRAPGQLLSHYAPNARVVLDQLSAPDDAGFLTFGPDTFSRGGAVRLNLSRGGDLEEAAANLFGYMRELDQAGVPQIVVMPIPRVGLGVAINDRLTRAAAPRS